MPKPRVLFVCIGNACRSQMAEGFGRTLGKDVFETGSAGLAPAVNLPWDTQEVMLEKGIDIGEQFPKDLDWVDLDSFSLIVNMSGVRFPVEVKAEVRNWEIEDPIGAELDVYRSVRDDIESRVRALAEELRGRQD